MPIESKKVKISSRERRKFRIRKKVSGTDARPRVSVFRSLKYTYAQLISDESGRTIASASTREKEVMDAVGAIDTKDLPSNAKSTKSALAARALGKVLAKRAQEKSVTAAVFDRNGYLFAGRVQALADGMREAGLKI